MSEKENQYIEITKNLINRAEEIPEEIHRQKSAVAEGILSQLDGSEGGIFEGMTNNLLKLGVVSALPKEFASTLLYSPMESDIQDEDEEGKEREKKEAPSIEVALNILSNPRCIEYLLKLIQGI